MSMEGKDRRHQHRRFAAGGNGHEQCDPRDIAEIERLQQRVRELKLNQHNHDHDDRSTTESEIWDDDGDDRFHNYFGHRNHRSIPVPPPMDPLRALGIRTEIPEFEGRLEPDDFLDWLLTVERIFDLRDIPDSLKVKLIAIKLKKSASSWWAHVHIQRHKVGKHKVDTWDKMKHLLKAKYLPVTYKQDSYLGYHNLRQNNLFVEDFIGEFERMRMRCDTTEDDEQVIARFLGCLRPEIADVVSLQQYYSFSDVCRLAYRVEQQLASKSKQASRLPPSPRVSTTAPTNPRIGPIKVGPQGAATPPAGPSNALRCYKCQGLGHLKRDCPNKQVLAFVDDADPVYDTEDDGESQVLYPDQGELLVSCRLLNTGVAGPDDDTTWLRNNIFRTKCTAKGKVCTVIIDGGSCENMVATSMVEKLGLPTQDHPTPYQLTWLKKGNLVKVTHKCLVQFSIGNKYTDEIWCEVIPMDACHVLLGRP